jgi:uncharacterized membrane protein YesL
LAWPVFLLSLRLLYRRLGILLAGNVLWLLLSLPVVTWPAATAALFYLVHRVILEERALDPDYARVSDFWVGFRRYGWQSTLVALLDVAVLFVLGVAFWFYNGSQIEPLRWLVGPIGLMGVAWLCAQLYLFPLLIVSPQMSPLALARLALFTAIGNPQTSVLLLVWLFIVTAVCVVLAGPVLFILFALLAVTQTMALRFIRIQRGEIEPAIMQPDS